MLRGIFLALGLGAFISETSKANKQRHEAEARAKRREESIKIAEQRVKDEKYKFWQARSIIKNETIQSLQFSSLSNKEWFQSINIPMEWVYSYVYSIEELKREQLLILSYLIKGGYKDYKYFKETTELGDKNFRISLSAFTGSYDENSPHTAYEQNWNKKYFDKDSYNIYYLLTAAPITVEKKERIAINLFDKTNKVNSEKGELFRAVYPFCNIADSVDFNFYGGYVTEDDIKQYLDEFIKEENIEHSTNPMVWFNRFSRFPESLITDNKELFTTYILSTTLFNLLSSYKYCDEKAMNDMKEYNMFSKIDLGEYINIKREPCTTEEIITPEKLYELFLLNSITTLYEHRPPFEARFEISKYELMDRGDNIKQALLSYEHSANLILRDRKTSFLEHLERKYIPHFLDIYNSNLRFTKLYSSEVIKRSIAMYYQRADIFSDLKSEISNMLNRGDIIEEFFIYVRYKEAEKNYTRYDTWKDEALRVYETFDFSVLNKCLHTTKSETTAEKNQFVSVYVCWKLFVSLMKFTKSKEERETIRVASLKSIPQYDKNKKYDQDKLVFEHRKCVYNSWITLYNVYEATGDVNSLEFFTKCLEKYYIAYEHQRFYIKEEFEDIIARCEIMEEYSSFLMDDIWEKVNDKLKPKNIKQKLKELKKMDKKYREDGELCNLIPIL